MNDVLNWVQDNLVIIIPAVATIIAAIITGALSQNESGSKTKNKGINMKGNIVFGNVTNIFIQMANKFKKKNKKYKKRNNKTKEKPIKLKSSHLYATSIHGKIFTNKFRKNGIYNFGLEVLLFNNSNKQQRATLSWCIYKRGNLMQKKDVSVIIEPLSTLRQDLYVTKQCFSSLSTGDYKSLFWINDKREIKEYFTITKI